MYQNDAMNIFITGGTGYMGKRLITELLKKGHQVTALVRPGSEGKLVQGAVAVQGDALNQSSYTPHIPRGAVLVHLVGVSHPSPAKAGLFRSIDYVSGREAVKAAQLAQVYQFIYLSVAQPAPVMKAYVQVRSEIELMIRESGLNATFLRPWYVLGPGHWWPVILSPVYWIFKNIPATQSSAKRLDLVTLSQMTSALVQAVEHPAQGIRIWEVPRIKEPWVSG